MAVVQLVYRVPVYVEVDTEEKTIGRVVVGVEFTERVRGEDMVYTGGPVYLARASDAQSEAAYEIAEDGGAEWPGWSFGF